MQRLSQTQVVQQDHGSQAGRAFGAARDYRRPSPKEVMAIEFLAPQNTTEISRRVSAPQKTPRTDFPAATKPNLPRLEAVLGHANTSVGNYSHSSSCSGSGSSSSSSSSGSSSDTARLHLPQQVYHEHRHGQPSGISRTPRGRDYSEDLDRMPRERRDPYSEEMQFFVIFARIIRCKNWQEIEDDFEANFGERRPRDGLTAMYYRLRKRWGMQQVTESEPGRVQSDVDIVHSRSRELSQQFLRSISYAR